MSKRTAGTPVLSVLLFLFACAYARAAEQPVAFTTKPTVSKSGDKTKIDFAVSRETDVAVYILDAQGKAVRHLVAGVVGKNAPEPLKPGLSQSVEWDGKDNAGKQATGGPFKVRVTLGMKPEFDSFVLNNPDGCGRVQALAVGPGGSIYVFHAENTANDNMGGQKIKVYNRDGKHQKVLVPFPADISPDKVKALGVFQSKEGDLIPRVHNWEHLSVYPDSIGSRGRDMPEYGSMPAVDSKGRVYWMVHGPRICTVDADCGIPNDLFLGPKLLADIKGLKMAGETYEFVVEGPAVAVSSDDKFVYMSGLATATAPVPCVFRVPADTRGPAEAFVGKPAQPGKEKDLLTAPRGLAVAKGLLYVADPGADRIVVFKEADRSYAGEIKVKSPQSIGVDPATGAVYVCSYGAKEPADLIKMSGFPEGKELFRLAKFNGSPYPVQQRIAVDASAKPVRIWVPEVMYAQWGMKCFEDSGDKFVDKGDPRSTAPWIEGPRDMTVDRVRDELYIKGNFGRMDGRKHWRLDEKTCKVLKDVNAQSAAAASGTQLVPGSDGNLYTLSFGSGLMRYDRDFKPLNFEGQSTNNIPIGGTMCFQERHLALKPYAPVDELYVVVPPFYRQVLEEKMSWDDAAKKARDHLAGRYTSLNVLGQDGKTKRTVIWQCLDSAIPRVDAKGNIYLVDSVKPMDRSFPEFFDGKLPEPGKGGSDAMWNSCMYASIIKFPPSGGVIWFAKGKLALSAGGNPPAELLAKPKVPFKTPYESGYGFQTDGVQGALWIHFGYSPYSIPGSGGACNCEGSGFDVDPFGRVFFPNIGQARVEVIDTNNNPITTFGKYGNEDSGGKDAKVKKPEIPLAWPVYVAVSDNYAYVADTVNRRVVRVKLAYAAEAVVPAN